MKWGFTSQRDGKEVPVTGNPAYDAATTTHGDSKQRDYGLQEGR
jgi:hypothetical protein